MRNDYRQVVKLEKDLNNISRNAIYLDISLESKNPKHINKVFHSLFLRDGSWTDEKGLTHQSCLIYVFHVSIQSTEVLQKCF